MKNWFLAILFLVLNTLLIPACSQQLPGKSEVATDEKKLEEYKLNKIREDVRLSLENAEFHLERARTFQWAPNLDNAEWGQSNSFKTVIPAIDLLINKNDIINFDEECTQYINSEKNLWWENPYKEPQSFAGKIEKPTIEDFRRFHAELYVKLVKLNENIDQYKKSTSGNFDKFKTMLAEESWREENFQEAFLKDSKVFLGIVDSSSGSISTATRSCKEIAAWEFVSLSTPVK